MTESKYAWIQTYEELASAIYRIRATPEKLTATLSRIFDGTTDLKFPKNAGEPYESSQVDPFTFFASFNRGIADDKRRKIIELACNELGVEAPQGPLDFAGIPLVNFNQNWFFGAKADRGEHDVEGLWDLFNAASNTPLHPTSERNRLSKSPMTQQQANSSLRGDSPPGFSGYDLVSS